MMALMYVLYGPQRRKEAVCRALRVVKGAKRNTTRSHSRERTCAARD